MKRARGAENEEEDVEEEANLELLCWGRLCTRWEKVAKEVRQTRVRERLVVIGQEHQLSNQVVYS